MSALLLGTCALAVSSKVHGQANPNPPERMTYQGFLVGSDGVALGNAAPKNYDVIFRIYDHETASAPANLLWAEQQTVTVDKGYFNVLLGEGASTGDPRPELSTLFRGATASDRFVGITVKGIGSGGANVDILPRLRLMSAPYAFLAQNAVKLVQNNASGTDLITSSGNRVTVSGLLDIAGNGALELGAGVAGKEPSAGKFGYQLFTADALDIVGAGTSGANRKVKIWAEGGATFTGPVTAVSYFGNGANLSGVAKLAGGNAFSGSQAILGGSLQLDNQALIVAKNNVGVYENFLFPRWSDNVTYLNYGAGGFNIRNNSSATTLFLGNEGRATFSGGVLARGGYPGSSSSGTGYAFSGSGGDNDSGMFSDLDGHVRFTSNSQLRFSVYPSGVYVHDGGLSVDSSNGRTFDVTGNVIRVFHGSNKARYFQMFRYDQGLAIQGYGGGWGNASGDFRQITWDGDGNWDAASDRKLKKDIVDAEPVLERALQVQVRRFRWKDDPDDAKLSLGVIAQELQPLFPDLIATQENPTTKETNLAVGYSDFGLIAVKALQEFKQKHDAEVADLKAQLAELKAQMAEVVRATSGQRDAVEKSKVTAAVDR